MAVVRIEDLGLPVGELLDTLEYPIDHEQLVRAAEDSTVSPDVINLFSALPRAQYSSKEEVLRDFAEAARRFGMWNVPPEDEAIRDRRNIGRDAVEGAPEGMTRHP